MFLFFFLCCSSRAACGGRCGIFFVLVCLFLLLLLQSELPRKECHRSLPLSLSRWDTLGLKKNTAHGIFFFVLLLRQSPPRGVSSFTHHPKKRVVTYFFFGGDAFFYCISIVRGGWFYFFLVTRKICKEHTSNCHFAVGLFFFFFENVGRGFALGILTKLGKLERGESKIWRGGIKLMVLSFAVLRRENTAERRGFLAGKKNSKCNTPDSLPSRDVRRTR